MDDVLPKRHMTIWALRIWENKQLKDGILLYMKMKSFYILGTLFTCLGYLSLSFIAGQLLILFQITFLSGLAFLTIAVILSITNLIQTKQYKTLLLIIIGLILIYVIFEVPIITRHYNSQVVCVTFPCGGDGETEEKVTIKNLLVEKLSSKRY